MPISAESGRSKRSIGWVDLSPGDKEVIGIEMSGAYRTEMVVEDVIGIKDFDPYNAVVRNGVRDVALQIKKRTDRTIGICAVDAPENSGYNSGWAILRTSSTTPEDYQTFRERLVDGINEHFTHLGLSLPNLGSLQPEKI